MDTIKVSKSQETDYFQTLRIRTYKKKLPNSILIKKYDTDEKIIVEEDEQ